MAVAGNERIACCCVSQSGFVSRLLDSGVEQAVNARPWHAKAASQVQGQARWPLREMGALLLVAACRSVGVPGKHILYPHPCVL